jgi:hypothetical protein
VGINDDLANEYVTHAVNIQRLAEGTKGEVLNLLTDLQGELSQMLHNEDLAGEVSTTDKLAKAENLLKETHQTIATAYDDIDNHVHNQLLEVADIASHQNGKILNSVFNKEVASTALTPNTLQELVKDTMIEGSPAGAWWKKQSDDTAHRFASQVRMGLAQGETTPQIVTRIIGKPTGKKIPLTNAKGKTKLVKEYAGGSMDVSKREATALVRTAVQTVNNNVQDKTFEQNQDILGGKQLLVTLDSRTSPICQARSGAAWDFKGEPLPSSPVKIPFPGPPPYHFNCRSILIPITKSWNDLIKEAGGEAIPGLDEVPQSTQASMDGQVAGNLTYEDWLKTKPEAFQREVLGPSKYQLWKEGKLSLAEMVDQSGNPLTVEQLKAKVGMKATDEAKGKRLTKKIQASNEVKTTEQIQAQDAQRKVEAENQKLREDHAKQLEQLKVEQETAVKNAQIAAANEAKAQADLEKAQIHREFHGERQQLKAQVEQQQAEVVKAKTDLEEAIKAKKKADSERVKAYKRRKKAEKEAAKLAEKVTTETKAKVEVEQVVERVKQAPPPFPPDTTKLTVVRKLGGSTGAELVKDEWGQQFVRKYGNSPEHLREEFQAENAYRAMGALVPESRLYEEGSKPVKLSKYIDGGTLLNDAKGHSRGLMEEDLSNTFVLDALMGNADVVGEGFDNVMLGNDNKTYRIDVGGSLRYRAQGALKDDTRWNGWATEVFTMRNPAINRQTSEVFKNVTLEDLITQSKSILARRADLLEHLDEANQQVMDRRLDSLAHFVKTSTTLLDDQFKPSYVESFGKHQMQMGAAKIFDALPKQLSNKKSGDVMLVDENGKPWDDLRGAGGITEKVGNYMKSQGGDHAVIEDWSGNQAGSSWGSTTQGLKAFLADQRKVDPETGYFWESNYATATSYLKGQRKKFGQQKYDESVVMWHAYHTQFLEQVWLPNKDEKQGMLRLIRTESEEVIEKYGMVVGYPKVIQRGLSESFSAVKPYTLYGNRVTTQEVPYHRVLGSYLHARSASGMYRDSSMFAGEHENEFTAFTQGIKVTYLGGVEANRQKAIDYLAGTNTPPLATKAFTPPAKTTPTYTPPVTPTDPNWTTSKPKPYPSMLTKVAAGGVYTPPGVLKDLAPHLTSNPTVLETFVGMGKQAPDIASAKQTIGEPKLLDLNLAAFNKSTGQFEYGQQSHFETYKLYGGKLPTLEAFHKVYFTTDGSAEGLKMINTVIAEANAGKLLTNQLIAKIKADFGVKLTGDEIDKLILNDPETIKKFAGSALKLKPAGNPPPV